MECPICYDTITKETGQVTTSCGHSFHFKCLNTWYWQQSKEEEGRESCPCCRKEPGEFEKASTVTNESEQEEEQQQEQQDEEYDSDEEFERANPEWVRAGPWRWIRVTDPNERLRILAQVASEQQKTDELRIPPYNPEEHALWVLRHLFEETSEPAGPQEEINPLDRPKLVRRRRRSFGRTFWSHLGIEYKLEKIDGYNSD